MKKFILLVYNDDTLLNGLPAGQFDSRMRDCLNHADDLRTGGRLLESQMLESPSTARSVRVRNGKQTVVDGPFTETKELLAGFWLIQVKSPEEAVEWAKRIPFREGEVEIRRVFDTEDFAASDPTGELREAEHRLREQVEARAAQV